MGSTPLCLPLRQPTHNPDEGVSVDILVDGVEHVDARKLLVTITALPPPESRKRKEARDGTAPFIAQRESSTPQGTALLDSGFRRPSG